MIVGEKFRLLRQFFCGASNLFMKTQITPLVAARFFKRSSVHVVSLAATFALVNLFGEKFKRPVSGRSLSSCCLGLYVVHNASYDEIINLIRDGQSKIQKHQFKLAEQSLWKAFHLALQKDEKDVLRIQSILANMYMQTGEYEKAEKIFKDMLKILLENGKVESDPAVLEISLKLSVIYGITGKHDLAVTGFDWIVDSCKKVVEKTPPTKQKSTEHKALLGMTLDSYGRYLHGIGKHGQAIRHTIEATQICKDLYGETDVRTAVMYNDIATMKMAMNDYSSALEYIQRIIVNCDAPRSNYSDSEKTVFYSNYAEILMKSGDMPAAKVAVKKALELAAKSSDKQTKQRVASLASSILLKSNEKKSSKQN